MKTSFWLFGQYESATLTIEQVLHVTGIPSVKRLRNMVAAGQFPRPVGPDRWHLEDVAAWLDRARNVPSRDEAA